MAAFYDNDDDYVHHIYTCTTNAYILANNITIIVARITSARVYLAVHARLQQWSKKHAQRYSSSGSRGGSQKKMMRNGYINK